MYFLLMNFHRRNSYDLCSINIDLLTILWQINDGERNYEMKTLEGKKKFNYLIFRFTRCLPEDAERRKKLFYREIKRKADERKLSKEKKINKS